MLVLLLGVLGLIRALRRLATPVKDVGLQRESRTVAWTIGILLTIGVLISLNPGLLNPVIDQLLAWFNVV
jgi:hypothetical protein